MHALKLVIYRLLPKAVKLQIRRTLFPTYLVAAKVVVTNENGQFLAVKTTYGPGWDIPSGHCDKRESPIDAAARELFEETGVVADNLQHNSVIIQPKTGTIQVIFTATAPSNSKLTPDSIEVSEVRWINAGDVKLNPYALEAIDIANKPDIHYRVSDLDH